jgi:hypothetical protein
MGRIALLALQLLESHIDSETTHGSDAQQCLGTAALALPVRRDTYHCMDVDNKPRNIELQAKNDVCH